MTRWRTCNNRRRRKERIASWWLLGGPSAPRTPLTLDKMREIVRLLSARRGLNDLLDYGIAITRDGKRVDPQDFYTEPCQ